MKFIFNFVTLKLFLNIFALLVTAEWCINNEMVVKSRIVWRRKPHFFNETVKLHYIRYSKLQTFHDYERVNVCCEGYTKISDTQCDPVCSPTCPKNTHCIRPNICECDVGYRGYPTNATDIQCEPICKPACSQNAQCVQPNKCSCIVGYKDVNGSGECQPICEKGCPENSNCTKPNECTCYTGYLDNGLGQCQPVCTQKCLEFSECTKPDTCTCQQNYTAVDDKCLPICQQECPQHAECIKPNECACQKGYATKIKTEAEGETETQQSNSFNFTCLAKCDEGCPAFANCTQPNVCECLPGYKKTETNSCEPICINDCPKNSNCTQPNNCTCNIGFLMQDKQCQAICEKTCPEHATCVEPNKCQCESGYQMKLSSIYNLFCEPICQRNCSTFGKCVQPNKCECLEGYEMDELESCKPVCSQGCKNGFCFQPEVCICHPGYLMGPQGECEPVCSMACQNGSCIEPEICQCHKGFKFQNNSINICEPICLPECINGICAAKNVCICHENYEPSVNEFGLDHNNCQLIQTATTHQHATALTQTATAVIATSIHPDKLKQNLLVSAHICSEQCVCWHEFDEFGPLTTPKCAHVCAEAFDKPCLDLNLCQCDVATNHLVCRTTDDDQLITDDPIFYKCNLLVSENTDSNPGEDTTVSSSDSTSERSPTASQPFLWWVIVLCVFMVCLGAIILINHFRKARAVDLMIDYEM